MDKGLNAYWFTLDITFSPPLKILDENERPTSGVAYGAIVEIGVTDYSEQEAQNCALSFIHEIEPKEIGIEKKEIFTETGKTSDWYILAYASVPNFSPSTQNRWILSGDGTPIFLEIKGQTLNKKIIQSLE